jgi:hypothetical protein
MKQTTLIIIVLLQAFSSFGQVVDFKYLSLDLSNLDYKNQYREFRSDTIEYPGEEYRWKWYFQKWICASRNREYFFEVKDSMPIGPIGHGTGSDVCPQIEYYYYHKNSLLWQGNVVNMGIGGVHFFENDGSVLIKWGCFWNDYNYSLFYDRKGNVFDTLSVNEQIFDLDNNLKLIRYQIESEYGNDGVDRIRCIDSRCRVLWTDSVVLRPGQYRGLELDQKGSKFSIHTNDSIWTYDSNLNLLWKRRFEKLMYSPHYIGTGDYMVGKKCRPIDEKSNTDEPELYIYDSKTGNLINIIDSIYYGNTFITSLSPRTIRNSGYVYYENIFWDIKKCDLIFTDIMGKVIFFKSFDLNNQPTHIEYNKGFNLYHNENLIETIKYKP